MRKAYIYPKTSVIRVDVEASLLAGSGGGSTNVEEGPNKGNSGVDNGVGSFAPRRFNIWDDTSDEE